MRNSLGPVGIGAAGTAEIGVEGMADTGAMGVAGETVKGISMFTATPGPSKVFVEAGR